MNARRVVVRGRVQGVFYRQSMIEVATATGVAGWVRNRADGSVEAFVQGEAAAVEAIVAWCRRGPPAARVDAVEATDAAPDVALAGFVQGPTL